MRTPPRLAALTALTSLAALALTAFPSAAAAQQTAQTGDLSVLSYNIAGLPLGIGDGDPETNTPIIGSRLGSYDIVQVQEDFNYHAALYAADDHPHRTATSGGVPFGDGLNTLSDMPFEDFERVKWNDCASGSADCITPKGFTFMRARLAEGVWVDLYNLHTDAGSEAADIAARAKNLAQVSAFMATHSAGNAVIVYGDTNTRYTRVGDGIAEFTADGGLTDAWVEQIRGGDAPNEGDPALVCEDATVDANCEVVDKILYRSGDHVRLDAGQYRNDHAAFRNGPGENLSDHYPIAVDFAWSTTGTFTLSDQFGGPHGDFFTDVDDLDAGDAPASCVCGGPREWTHRRDPRRRHRPRPRRQRRHPLGTRARTRGSTRCRCTCARPRGRPHADLLRPLHHQHRPHARDRHDHERLHHLHGPDRLADHRLPRPRRSRTRQGWRGLHSPLARRRERPSTRARTWPPLSRGRIKGEET